MFCCLCYWLSTILQNSKEGRKLSLGFMHCPWLTLASSKKPLMFWHSWCWEARTCTGLWKLKLSAKVTWISPKTQSKLKQRFGGKDKFPFSKLAPATLSWQPARKPSLDLPPVLCVSSVQVEDDDDPHKDAMAELQVNGAMSGHYVRETSKLWVVYKHQQRFLQ